MFPTTNWTKIEGGRVNTAARRSTLGELALAYRRPLVIVARKRGLPPEQAEDVVQELFVKLVERDIVRGLDRQRGRLRSFLRVALTRAIATHLERARAGKRGGGVADLDLDADLDADLPGGEQPDAVFDRAWQMAILERAFVRLASEYPRERFALIEQQLAGDDRPLAEIARIHGTTEGAIKSLVHRARRRYRALAHAEVAATIGPHVDLASELRALGM